MQSKSAQAVWTAMEADKSPLMTKCERFAQLTLPKLCLAAGKTVENSTLAHDYQSLGAQAVNHAANKAMMVLFPPSHPFFVLEATGKTLAQLQEMGMQPDDLTKSLAKQEQAAVRNLQKSAQRPKLHQAVKHLIVTGNVLLDLSAPVARVMGLRYYCVKRDVRGRVFRLMIREHVPFEELDTAVKTAINSKHKRYTADSKVSLYKWIQRQPNGDYIMSQWVDEQRLPKEFDGKWPEAKMPYHALCWDLGDEDNYATGLVEEYIGDFEALSGLAESVVEGGILSALVRYMINPSGMTQPDDLKNSRNGDALPGMAEDVKAVQAGNHAAVLAGLDVLNRWEQRLARGFLLLSAIRRDAERVTAEELRQDAQELETAWGGVYSTLGVTLQKPVAEWQLSSIDMDVRDTDIEVAVVTGLDALGRNSDIDRLRYALGDLSVTQQLPVPLQGRIKWKPLTAFVGAGRGIDLAQYLMSEEEYAQAVAQSQESRVAEATATAAGEAAAKQEPTE